MRILILHSRYASGPVSGENRVVDDEAELLTSAGHNVHVWAPMLESIGPREILGAAVDAVWSRRAVRIVRSLVRSFRPDVVHCHNLFPLISPAAIRAAAENAPVVVTLHNYRLLCLPATFVRGGVPCEACLGRLPWRGVRYRCYRDSLPGSGALATSLVAHRALGSFDRVSLYLAVSDFVRKKHVEAGLLQPGRIRVKPNFVWPQERRRGPGSYFAFVGRLSADKGIGELVDAWRVIPAPLILVGAGPEQHALEQHLPKNVTMRGAVPPSEVADVLGGARALVFPTRAYEGAPRAILEAFASGVPVIASGVGALTELVEDGESGLLFNSLRAPQIAAAATRLLEDDESERMGEAAWHSWRTRYSPERGLAELEAAYHSVRGVRAA
jgi:glycosyltransferase involved in cell wall biosynthesis